MNVMIDLETLGNRPGAVILAIGAVAFDGERIAEEFYERIDAESCVKAGLQMDVSTVIWWLQQSDAARMEIVKPGEPLAEVLERFAGWLLQFGKVEVWGNGAAFDNAVLAEAYRRLGQPLPWEFCNDRCYRTMKKLHPETKMARRGTHHNALDDARDQALHLMEIVRGRAVGT